MTRRRSQRHTWRDEAESYTRAFAGAFLFGIPLVMTMEMWWIGTFLEPTKLLAFLGFAFVANLALVHVSGFREEGRTLWSDLEEALEAVAVGGLGSAVVLVVLGRIGPGQSLDASLGMIVIQTIPLSIGASVANIVLRGGDQTDGAIAGHGPVRETLFDLGATAAGAIFLAFSIAPTEEVPMLAAEMSLPHQLALIAFSLLLAYGIVFESQFAGQARRHRQQGIFQRPVSETAASYIVSLAIAFVALVLFDQITPRDPLQEIVAETLVLGLPATIGGAAGRVLL